VSTQLEPHMTDPAGQVWLDPPSEPHPAATRPDSTRAPQMLMVSRFMVFMVRSFPLFDPRDLKISQLIPHFYFFSSRIVNPHVGMSKRGRRGPQVTWHREGSSQAAPRPDGLVHC